MLIYRTRTCCIMVYRGIPWQPWRCIVQKFIQENLLQRAEPADSFSCCTYLWMTHCVKTESTITAVCSLLMTEHAEVLESGHSGPTLHSKNKKLWPRFTPLAWDFLKLHLILRLFLPKPFFSPFFNVCQTHFMLGKCFLTIPVLVPLLLNTQSPNDLLYV